MLDNQREDSDVYNRLRKFTLTVGGTAKKDELQDGKEVIIPPLPSTAYGHSH